ncbi:MAG: ACT domain-containing protein, partial [bacterium]|nr:ACT domain-containing protein [bacterium]
FPSISGELLRLLQPYITLGEKLGSLQGQLTDYLPAEISIEYRGSITEWNLSAVTNAFLKGLFSHMLSDVVVNYVNAPALAKERGLKVIESKVTEHEDFSSLMTATIRNKEKSFSVSGTIFGKKHPRIVRINDFYLEAVPEGKILVVHNHDKPGVIGNIGTLLGENKINIARMQLGLQKGKSEAIALYNIEGNTTPVLLKKLEAIPNIISVKEVVL